MNFSFPYVGNNHPNLLLYFSEGLKPPTSHTFVTSDFVQVYHGPYYFQMQDDGG